MSNASSATTASSSPTAAKRALAPLCAALVLSALAQGQGPLAWRHAWRYASGLEGWIGQTVDVGDHGGQVFTAFEGFTLQGRLLSSHDNNPALPVWVSPPAYFGFSPRVRSNDSNTLHALFAFTEAVAGAPRRPTLRMFDSGSSTPLWSYEFPVTVQNPPAGLSMSTDGQRTLAWFYNATTNRTVLGVFQPGSSVPIATWNVDSSGQTWNVHMSADGNFAYVTSQLRTMVVDLGTGALLHNTVNFDAIGTGHAITSDGFTFARSSSTRRVSIYTRTGSTYAQTYQYDLGVDAMCARAAFSPDGSQLAMGFNVGSAQVRIVIVDAIASSHPVLMDRSYSGTGTYSQTISDLAFDAAGRTLAVGTSGDQNGLLPELLVFERSMAGAWSPAFTYDLPGSVYDVALSPNGRRLAIASKSVHFNVLASGGEINLIELGERDVRAAGRPVQGTTIQVDATAQPGALVTLLVANRLANQPTVFPGLGTLHLPRAQVLAAGTAVADANGHAWLPFAIPPGAAQVGQRIYFQTLVSTPRRLSASWDTVTVLP